MTQYGTPTSRYTILDDRATVLVCRTCSAEAGGMVTIARSDEANHDQWHASHDTEGTPS